MRCLGAVVAAILSLLLVLVVVAVLASTRVRDETAAVVTTICFFAIPLIAFALVYRAIPPGRNATERAIERRRRLAISRRIPEKAQTIARGGDGVWQTDTWRVTGGDTPTIQVVENGAWETVFEARFHPGREGQWVPVRIRKDVFSPDSLDARTVHSETRGGRPARWEILVYRSGPWEDELDDQVRAAEEAALARDRERMGLT